MKEVKNAEGLKEILADIILHAGVIDFLNDPCSWLHIQ